MNDLLFLMTKFKVQAYDENQIDYEKQTEYDQEYIKSSVICESFVRLNYMGLPAILPMRLHSWCPIGVLFPV